MEGINDGIEIEAEGVKYALVNNYSLVLLNNTDSLTVPFKYKTINWKLNIVFTNDDNEKKLGGKVEYKDTTIIYKLNKWQADTFIENEGIKLTSTKVENAPKFKIKVRLNAQKNNPYKQIGITIWVQI